MTQGTGIEVEGTYPHLMKIRVTASKMISDPPMPKKTSKMKKPMDFSVLEKSAPNT